MRTHVTHCCTAWPFPLPPFASGYPYMGVTSVSLPIHLPRHGIAPHLGHVVVLQESCCCRLLKEGGRGGQAAGDMCCQATDAGIGWMRSLEYEYLHVQWQIEGMVEMQGRAKVNVPIKGPSKVNVPIKAAPVLVVADITTGDGRRGIHALQRQGAGA